jgi:hypothetical protein
MAQPSRRKFLAAAGAGAAGVAAVGIAGTAGASALGSSAPASPTGASPQLPKNANGSLVAYVTDVRAGRVSLLVGENKIEINDHDLVARLAQAAHPADPEV